MFVKDIAYLNDVQAGEDEESICVIEITPPDRIDKLCLAITALQQMQSYAGTCNTCGEQIYKGYIFCPHCGEFPEDERKEQKPCGEEPVNIYAIIEHIHKEGRCTFDE